MSKRNTTMRSTVSASGHLNLTYEVENYLDAYETVENGEVISTEVEVEINAIPMTFLIQVYPKGSSSDTPTAMDLSKFNDRVYLDRNTGREEDPDSREETDGAPAAPHPPLPGGATKFIDDLDEPPNRQRGDEYYVKPPLSTGSVLTRRVLPSEFESSTKKKLRSRTYSRSDGKLQVAFSLLKPTDIQRFWIMDFHMYIVGQNKVKYDLQAIDRVVVKDIVSFPHLITISDPSDVTGIWCCAPQENPTEYLPGEKLKLRIKGNIILPVKIAADDIVPAAGNVVQGVSFNWNFSKLFNSKKFSDMKIVAENYTYHVHRVIIWTASPYFQNLIDSELNSEKKTYSLTIDGEGLGEVLYFIYHGNCPKLRELIYKITLVAFEVEIYPLVSKAVALLLNTGISFSNFHEFANIGVKICSPELYTVAYNFFKANEKKIRDMPEWKMLEKAKSPELKAILSVFSDCEEK